VTHAEMDDLYELYVLGALEPELAAEIEQHLQEQCSYCVEHVQEATQLAALMAGMAESVKLPAQLRSRVLATIATAVAPAVIPTVAAPAPRRARNWMFAFAALSAACLALAAFSLWSRSELQQTSSQLQSTASQRDQLQSALTNASSSERQEVAALTAERDRLRSALTTANNTAALQAAALTGERDRLRAALGTATNTERTEVAALSGERDQLRSALTSANATARAQVASLTAERDQLRTALAAANVQQRTQMASLEGERDQLQSALAIMRKPDTRSVRFGTPAAAHGWVFANRNGGLVFVGSELPAVASDRILELWLVPNTGAPQPAGLFRPTDVAGDTLHVSSLAIDPSHIKAVAVSDEPRAGSTAPTTKPFLLVPLG